MSPEFYKISFEQPGFKNFIIDNFKIVNSTYGKISQDIVLDGDNSHEPCGYSGADCLNLPPIEIKKSEPSDKILQRPLEKLPKKVNKTKRKNKNNK